MYFTLTNSYFDDFQGEKTSLTLTLGFGLITSDHAPLSPWFNVSICPVSDYVNMTKADLT